MRSDRRKEILAQMEEEKAQKKKKRGTDFFRTVATVYFLLALAFIGLVYWLDILPLEYFAGLVTVIALITVFTVPILYSKKGKKWRKVIACLVAVFMVCGFGAGSYYLADTIQFLGAITMVQEVTEDYYVLVKADATYEDVSELSGMSVGTFMVNDLSYSAAKANLQNEVDVTYSYAESFANCIQSLVDGSHEAVFVSAAAYRTAQDGIDLESETKILYTVKIPVETQDNTSKVNVLKESYNIYISGTDLDGYRSDVNMIATVNPVTHHVMLTSIPRDYYVTLPSKGAQDKLTHAGIYGVQETVGAVENLLGIDINYYAKVNYASLKGLVDAIGGIDVESEYAFTTSGMGKLNGHSYTVGMNHMDGAAALAFCRERHSFVDGDMQRNKNQQAVLKAIIEKATSSSTIMSSYGSILNAIGGNLETNMDQDAMSKIIKDQLKTMASWKIEKQSIMGTPGFGHCYAIGAGASIVNQNPENNAKAIDEIVRVMTAEKE